MSENRKPSLIHRIKFWFKLRFRKKDKPYSVKSIKPIQKAKAMDSILELCIKYKVREENNVIDFYKVEELLCDDLELHSWESELLLDILKDQEYTKEEYKENGDIQKILIRPKGIEKYINGGFELEARRKRNERRLIRITQWSSLIVGVYYLAMFLKDYLGVTPELLKNLICNAYNLLNP